MMFKNTFRLFSSNFDKVWKTLVFQILSWGIVAALLAPFYGIISEAIKKAWVVSEIGANITNGTFYGVNVANALTSVCNMFIETIKLVFTTSVGAGVYSLIVIIFIHPILSNVRKYVNCEMLYGYMASSSKHGFTITLLRTLKRSLPYAALKSLYDIPFNALILASLLGLTYIENPAYGYAMPILIVIVPSICFAFKETFTAGWAPAMIVFDYNAAKAYPKGMKASLRRGLRVFSTAFVIYLLAFVLSMILGVYALIIILPVIFPLLDIFEMVMFFSSQGMRFYVDADTILTPKKLEEVDKIEDAKYLL